MLESFKNAFFASLGMVAMTGEKLRAFVDEMVKRGDLTAEQGRKLVEEFLARGQEESKAFSEKVAAEASNLMEKTPFATRSQLRRLEERVRALEARLVASAPEEVEPGGSRPRFSDEEP